MNPKKLRTLKKLFPGVDFSSYNKIEVLNEDIGGSFSSVDCKIRTERELTLVCDEEVRDSVIYEKITSLDEWLDLMRAKAMRKKGDYNETPKN